MNDSKKIELHCGSPLLIYGLPGTGKTHLALELLNDTILLRIDVSQIRRIKNMKTYILDKLKKRNVTLMFEEKKERGLLIDDIHVFHKHDKSCYKSFIEFVRGGFFYKSKIIITCCKTFINNKEIRKLKIDRHEMKYTYPNYYKLCLRIAEEKKLNINLESLDDKIIKSYYNLNIFLSECEQNDKKLLKDNYDDIQLITSNMMTKKFSLREIFRICGGDEKTILLNLIENITNDYIEIYNFCDNFNRKDMFIYANHFLNIPIIKINSTKQNNNDIIYNRYISKNMIRHKYMKYDILSNEIIYLIDTYQMTENKKIKDKLSQIDSKILKYHINIYESFYDIKPLYQLS